MRHVSSCLESKFDQKIPMGSVPNCQKEIADRYPIRWFKCKLKPPKKEIVLIFTKLQLQLFFIIKLFQCYSRGGA